MTKFNCMKCGYRFELSKELPPKVCPYCGKEGGVRKEQSAEQILSEVGSIRE